MGICDCIRRLLIIDELYLVEKMISLSLSGLDQFDKQTSGWCEIESGKREKKKSEMPSVAGSDRNAVI